MNLEKAENSEYIGRVKMNYSLYPGEDLYSDGQVEDELLDIVKNNAPEDFPEIIKEKASWAILYHLSEYRENIFSVIPFDKNDEVLEIGAGCGAVTGYLCRKAGNVTAVELSKKRSLINAYRHRDEGNLEILVANFENACGNLEKKYDYVTLIGVLEYAKLYIDSEHPFEDLLIRAKSLLKPRGKLIIAIENRFGLKYFAGCREDHLGTVFSGINGYSNGTDQVRTFTKKELEGLIEKSGFSEYTFYYPYPDYKFATDIYSDAYLPKKGDLCNNGRNYDNARLELFNEEEVFDGLIDNGVFPCFSNSFLVVVS